MEQARDFYESATETGRVAASPLTLYYCLMNLVKAFCLTRATRATFDKAQHGLSEKLKLPGSRELVDAFLQGFPSPGPSGLLQLFSEFKLALTGTGLAAAQSFDIPVLLPQVLPGHRLWSFGSGRKERFIALHDILASVNDTSRTAWLSLFVVADDLSRLGVSHAEFLADTGLAPRFAQVACTEKDASGKKLLQFEQVTPLALPNSKYANQVQTLFDLVRQDVWTTVASIPPYRRYYVYMCPSADRPYLLHQLLSIYAMSYYLGSITRYRPHHFDLIVDGDYGPRIRDFITGQPLQFLYLIASEFAKQEIAKPSIV